MILTLKLPGLAFEINNAATAPDDDVQGSSSEALKSISFMDVIHYSLGYMGVLTGKAWFEIQTRSKLSYTLLTYSGTYRSVLPLQNILGLFAQAFCQACRPVAAHILQAQANCSVHRAISHSEPSIPQRSNIPCILHQTKCMLKHVTSYIIVISKYHQQLDKEAEVILVMHLLLFQYTQSPEFEEHCFIYKFFYMYPTFAGFRLRMFIGMALAECVCQMSGLGAYPVSCHPVPGLGPRDYKTIEKL